MEISKQRLGRENLSNMLIISVFMGYISIIPDKLENVNNKMLTLTFRYVKFCLLKPNVKITNGGGVIILLGE